MRIFQDEFIRCMHVRTRKSTGSGKVVSDLDVNIPFRSDFSMGKTDGSREIGNDGVSLVSLFLLS